MLPAFPSVSWWLWSGKQSRLSDESLSNFSSEAGLWESALRYPLVSGAYTDFPSRRVDRKWNRREQQGVDREYDVVLVPPDGGCVSGSDSDSDCSDWSVGWLEPHGPEFLSEDDMNNSFAVLVPCYGKVHADILGNVGSTLDSHSYDNHNMKSMVPQFSSLSNARH